jgi:heptosyltransferase-2
MVMAQVLFKLLKQQDPSAQIDVLAPKWSMTVLQRMPEINRMLCLPIEHGQFALRTRIKLACELRSSGYTQAIVLANSWKSALIPWLARIPKRTGWLGEMRWLLLNDVRFLNKKALPLMVQRYAALAFPAKQALPQTLPVPKLNAPADSVENVLKKYSVDLAKPVLALCPGAAYGPAKRWPEEYYARVAKEKIAAGWQVWLFGAKADETVVENIQAKIGSATVFFGSNVNLLETVDLLSVANAVVTNDSGLMHIAASMDKPLVAVYGSTTPKFTPPLGNKAKILQEDLACRPCFKRTCPLQHMNCMYLVTPERVINALNELQEV